MWRVRVTDADAGPEALAVARETIELALLAALQLLSPRQRAVFIARDIVGLSVGEAALLLDTTVEAVNSLVQRARITIRANEVSPSTSGSRRPTASDRQLMDRYITAHERGDVDAIVALLAPDVVMTMPPEPAAVGIDSVAATFRSLLASNGLGDWLLVPIFANRQPAAANYLRAPGARQHRANSIDVFRIEGGRVVGIHCFLRESLFDRFGLPLVHTGVQRPTHPTPKGPRHDRRRRNRDA
jgi:RNA polymerase sigma-70 factor (TIGR02960 family)